MVVCGLIEGTMRGSNYSMRILRAVFALVALVLAGCASVSSTSQFYLPYTETVYPPKPKDARIPILGKAPARAHKVIGRLSFSTSEGWGFLRKSMEYNARQQGADAVILRSAQSRNRTTMVQVPAQFDWIPVSGPAYRDRKGRVCYGTTYVPIYRPGYTYPSTWTITSLVADMIVFKK